MASVEHLCPELIKPSPACQPSRRRDENGIPRIKIECLLDKKMVDRGVTRTTCATSHLVGGITYNHVELHFASKQLGHPSRDVIGVNERIGVGLKPLATVKGLLAGAAILALAINPRVLDALEPDVAVVALEGLGNGVLALGVLCAIHTPASK